MCPPLGIQAHRRGIEAGSDVDNLIILERRAKRQAEPETKAGLHQLSTRTDRRGPSPHLDQAREGQGVGQPISDEGVEVLAFCDRDASFNALEGTGRFWWSSRWPRP